MPADKEEMALTLNGKKAKLKRQDFETFGYTVGMTQPQIEKIIKRICDAASAHLDEALARSFLPDEMQDCFAASFKKRADRVNPTV